MSPAEEELVQLVAEGRAMKAIAASQGTTAETVADAVEQLFLKLAHRAGQAPAARSARLGMLHHATSCGRSRARH